MLSGFCLWGQKHLHSPPKACTVIQDLQRGHHDHFPMHCGMDYWLSFIAWVSLWEPEKLLFFDDIFGGSTYFFSHHIWVGETSNLEKSPSPNSRHLRKEQPRQIIISFPFVSVQCWQIGLYSLETLLSGSELEFTTVVMPKLRGRFELPLDSKPGISQLSLERRRGEALLFIFPILHFLFGILLSITPYLPSFLSHWTVQCPFPLAPVQTNIPEYS